MDPVLRLLRAMATPLLFLSAAFMKLQNQQGWGCTLLSLTHYKKQSMSKER